MGLNARERPKVYIKTWLKLSHSILIRLLVPGDLVFVGAAPILSRLFDSLVLCFLCSLSCVWTHFASFPPEMLSKMLAMRGAAIARFPPNARHIAVRTLSSEAMAAEDLPAAAWRMLYIKAEAQAEKAEDASKVQVRLAEVALEKSDALLRKSQDEVARLNLKMRQLTEYSTEWVLNFRLLLD